jgi:hypothetical protein
MRDRVAAAGGTLSAGPTGDGAWRVEARVPDPEDAVAAPGRGTGGERA